MEQLLYQDPAEEDGRAGMKPSVSGERGRPAGNNLFTVSPKTQTKGHQIQLIRRQVQSRERFLIQEMAGLCKASVGAELTPLRR